MKIGTKSILFGYHAFWLHPWFVALGWYRLYGFWRVYCPGSDMYVSLWDPRLWVAFFVHDLGYWGKPNMDGEEGETHPWFGFIVMDILFGEKWGNFSLFHSRFLAKRYGARYSLLCPADKMAIVITPTWLFLFLNRLTGEIVEYRKLARGEARYTGQDAPTEEAWALGVKDYCQRWARRHKWGSEDSWTPEAQVALNKEGVY